MSAMSESVLPPPRIALTQEQIDQGQQMMQMALRGPVPRFHANSCAIAQSSADVALVMTSNGVAVSTTNMSYETAKNMSEELARAVSNFESVTGQEVKRLREIQEPLQKLLEQNNVQILS